MRSTVAGQTPANRQRRPSWPGMQFRKERELHRNHRDRETTNTHERPFQKIYEVLRFFCTVSCKTLIGLPAAWPFFAAPQPSGAAVLASTNPAALGLILTPQRYSKPLSERRLLIGVRSRRRQRSRLRSRHAALQTGMKRRRPKSAGIASPGLRPKAPKSHWRGPRVQLAKLARLSAAVLDGNRHDPWQRLKVIRLLFYTAG